MFGLLDNQNWDIAAEHYFQNFSVKAIVYIPCGDAVGSIRAVAHQERRDLISCLLYISDGFCSVCIDRGGGVIKDLVECFWCWSWHGVNSTKVAVYAADDEATASSSIVVISLSYELSEMLMSSASRDISDRGSSLLACACRIQSGVEINVEGLSPEVMFEGIVLVLAPQTLAVL